VTIYYDKEDKTLTFPCTLRDASILSSFLSMSVNSVMRIKTVDKATAEEMAATLLAASIIASDNEKVALALAAILEEHPRDEDFEDGEDRYPSNLVYRT
jgi:hypothetical protein